jgi:hypothetical protein
MGTQSWCVEKGALSSVSRENSLRLWQSLGLPAHSVIIIKIRIHWVLLVAMPMRLSPESMTSSVGQSSTSVVG